jgi:S-adenosylhomocysteine hydrolase
MIVGINFVIARYGFCGNDVVNKVNVLDINLIIIKIKPTAVLKTTLKDNKIALIFLKIDFLE